MRKSSYRDATKTLAGIVLAPVVVILALTQIGHPGLRWQYSWNGNKAFPHYYKERTRSRGRALRAGHVARPAPE